MSDLFLWAHELTTHIYDISTDLKPGSIRDQIIRGTLLVRRAFEQGVINQNGRPLLVIGAGAAGVTAAVTAARLQVPTRLIDKKPHAFALQRGCATRFIEPTVYDWPAAHWQKARYPWIPREPKPALSLRRAIAQRVVEDVWDVALAQERADLAAFLDVRYGTRITNFPPPMRMGRFRVTFDTCPGAFYGMIVLAKGFGAEQDRLGDGSWFRSYRFWDTDTLSAVAASRDRVLISGGGDGGLQDFLRLVLRRSDRLPAVIGRLPAAPETLAVCHSVSEHRNASSVWCLQDEHDHEIERFMHESYRDHIEELWDHARTRTQIEGVMAEILRDPLPDVTLVHWCDHFSRSYPINRFLVLLIDKYVREQTRSGTRLVREDREVGAIACLHAHREKPDKDDCYRSPHRVNFRPVLCALAPGNAPLPADLGEQEYDVILLRHGARGMPHEAPPGGTPLSRPWYKNPRQVLPYHLGHTAR